MIVLLNTASLLFESFLNLLNQICKIKKIIWIDEVTNGR